MAFAGCSNLFKLGVGVSKATELVVHALRDWASSSSITQELILQLDFKNAFNSLNRLRMLLDVRARFPSLSPFAEWCYSRPSPLFYDDATILSAQGVQQGDPPWASCFCSWHSLFCWSAASSCTLAVLVLWWWPFDWHPTPTLLCSFCLSSFSSGAWHISQFRKERSFRWCLVGTPTSPLSQLRLVDFDEGLQILGSHLHASAALDTYLSTLQANLEL